MKLTFADIGWHDYLYWQGIGDKKILNKIHKLIADIERNGYDGIGHPEPLKGTLSGWYSRQIDDCHRLVYRVFDDDTIEIMQCRGHYGDK